MTPFARAGQFVFAQDGEILIESDLTGGDWLRAGLIVIGAIVLAAAASRVTRHLLRRWIGGSFAALITARLIAYIIVLLGFFYALTELGVRVGPLLGALGLGGLVLALALQKLVENFVAGVILQTMRPFTIGETVTIAGETGTVTDIDSRTTVLRDLDGRVVRIPNSNVVDDNIINLTREPLRRSTLEVGVVYHTDLELAWAEIMGAISRAPRIAAEPAPMVALTRFGSSSIDFTLYYWHASDVPTELAARHDLMLAIHQNLAQAGITIAFPQLVVWEGRASDDEQYVDRPDEVRTEHPGLSAVESEPKRRQATWRLPRRNGN